MLQIDSRRDGSFARMLCTGVTWVGSVSARLKTFAVSKFIPTMNNLLPIPLVRYPAGAPEDFGPNSPILDLVKYDMLEEIKKRFQQPPFAGNINAKIISCGNPLI